MAGYHWARHCSYTLPYGRHTPPKKGSGAKTFYSKNQTQHTQLDTCSTQFWYHRAPQKQLSHRDRHTEPRFYVRRIHKRLLALLARSLQASRYFKIIAYPRLVAYFGAFYNFILAAAPARWQTAPPFDCACVCLPFHWRLRLGKRVKLHATVQQRVLCGMSAWFPFVAWFHCTFVARSTLLI